MSYALLHFLSPYVFIQPPDYFYYFILFCSCSTGSLFTCIVSSSFLLSIDFWGSSLYHKMNIDDNVKLYHTYDNRAGLAVQSNLQRARCNTAGLKYLRRCHWKPVKFYTASTEKFQFSPERQETSGIVQINGLCITTTQRSTKTFPKEARSFVWRPLGTVRGRVSWVI